MCFDEISLRQKKECIYLFKEACKIFIKSERVKRSNISLSQYDFQRYNKF